jgi:hypothetical protein
MAPTDGAGLVLTQGENELLTRVGPGTPMGALMRRLDSRGVFPSNPKPRRSASAGQAPGRESGAVTRHAGTLRYEGSFNAGDHLISILSSAGELF